VEITIFWNRFSSGVLQLTVPRRPPPGWRLGEAPLFCSTVSGFWVVGGGGSPPPLPPPPGRCPPRSTARARPGNRSCSCATLPHASGWRSASGPQNKVKWSTSGSLHLIFPCDGCARSCHNAHAPPGPPGMENPCKPAFSRKMGSLSRRKTASANIEPLVYLITHGGPPEFCAAELLFDHHRSEPARRHPDLRLPHRHDGQDNTTQGCT